MKSERPDSERLARELLSHPPQTDLVLTGGIRMCRSKWIYNDEDIACSSLVILSQSKYSHESIFSEVVATFVEADDTERSATTMLQFESAIDDVFDYYELLYPTPWEKEGVEEIEPGYFYPSRTLDSVAS